MKFQFAATVAAIMTCTKGIKKPDVLWMPPEMYKDFIAVFTTRYGASDRIVGVRVLEDKKLNSCHIKIVNTLEPDNERLNGVFHLLPESERPKITTIYFPDTVIQRVEEPNERNLVLTS